MATTFLSIQGRRPRLASGLIALGLMLWLLTQADWPTMRTSLHRLDLAWLGAALLSVVTTLVVRVTRWRALLPGPPRTYPVWMHLWRATLRGQALNLLLPLRTGDLARALEVGQIERVNTTYIVGTIGAEKLLDAVCLGITIMFLLQLRPDMAPWLSLTQSGLTLLLLSGLLGVAWLFSRASLDRNQNETRPRPDRVNPLLLSPNPAVDPAGRLTRPMPALRLPPVVAVRQKLQHLAAGLMVLKRPAILGAALAWSIPLWLGHLFNNYATARALALPLDWSGALLVLVVLQAGLAFPSTPAKVGVFQALCAASLGLLGYSPAAGLAYGLVLQWVVMLPPLALLLLDLGWERVK